MLNTIVAENYLGAGPDDNAVGPDMNGGAISLGFNLIGMTNGSCCWTAGDVYLPGGQLAPLLQPLNFYGGPTPTMMPQSGSAAIDNGTSGGLSTDQRGLPRPSRFNGGNPLPPGGDGSDIGAVELQAVQLYIEPTLVAGQRQFTLYWQNTEPSYRLVRLLQTSGAGLLSSSWTMSSLPIMTINGTNRAAITSPTNNAFFRLLLAP
jgi:hypothetical protein